MDNFVPIVIFLVIFFIVAGILAYMIRIVPQAEAYVMERLGAYNATWTTGVHFLVPFIDRVANKITLKEIVKDFDPQPVITKDNVTMQIDTVVYFQITDPKLYTYGVVGPITAIENLTATTLRNIIGDLELDETLTSRDIINTQMRSILDEATDPWGIKVNRVEVKNIIPPKDIQEAMEKQMRAERERRESILKAEGEKKSAILVAEGEKESTVLRAEAKKAAMIAEAEGRAEALAKVYEAEARGIQMINESNPSKEYLSLKSLETYEKMADGQATKIVIPSELQSIASLLTAAKEMTGKDK
ncbi:MAG: SPFH/Band 7/PHB domain protein [Erysipelotrichaceae bacterium]|nr:SPFH/Band 7/PHB domain protein [Erysipelotrichaceae bacterium]MBR2544636.1 SPFH/Band 7/PHB domain protein [Erysipelotrichaceae bacterium]MBR2700913.1 SPFH/Band 7/PHB domain protein [Erysipelotrichaceae bacterium]MBR2746401.1 SPFH/Band 7/PHB domain protein [Erysipelotrichaceae bacterium]